MSNDKIRRKILGCEHFGLDFLTLEPSKEPTKGGYGLTAVKYVKPIDRELAERCVLGSWMPLEPNWNDLARSTVEFAVRLNKKVVSPSAETAEVPKVLAYEVRTLERGWRKVVRFFGHNVGRDFRLDKLFTRFSA